MMQHDQEWLEKLDEIIEQNISDSDFQLMELATAIMISPAQLNRKINKLTGLPPRMYVRRKKLTKNR